MKVSVIVASYGRHALLSKCLASLLEQRRLPDQIVGAFVGGDAGTRKFFAEAASLNPRVEFTEAVTGKPDIVAQENAGLKVAKGEFVCFIDDDAVAPPGWLGGILSHYAQDPLVGAVGGPVVPCREGKPVFERTKIFSRMTWYGRRITDAFRLPESVQDVAFLCGANMSFRKELLGAFDERLLPYWRRFEDDACLSVREQGSRVICDPALFVFHTRAGSPDVDKDKATLVGLHHNSVYVKLKHSRGLRRLVTFVYELFWGDLTSPGGLQILLHGLVHPRKGIFFELRYALTGKLKGLATYRGSR